MSAHRIRYASCAASLTMGLSAGMALAGGPTLVGQGGAPLLWNTGTIAYQTDNGPLSATVNEATARGRVQAMFTIWQNVPTSSIAYSRTGFISTVPGFSGGDVDTLAEYNAVRDDCNVGGQSPVIYDDDGSLFAALGIDNDSVIGIAGPCSSDGVNVLSGFAVMNGLFQDGAGSVPDLSTAQYDAAILHELGHFSGLDHSQINVNCLNPCGASDLAGLPTMFPFLVHNSQGQLGPDDIAWISRFYPQTTGGSTFAGTHGMITGTVYFSDGESQAQFVNVIARQVDIGGDEDRRIAASSVSGFRFRAYHGNPINDSGGTSPGSEVPSHIGLFEIPVPAGNYRVEVESIDAEFTDGSSVGGLVRIAMPGTAPAPSAPFNVAAGSTSSGHDVTLIGTQPRFDQFEGP